MRFARSDQSPNKTKDTNRIEYEYVTIFTPQALASCDSENSVFYEDEVDIHLNPKIGADWGLRGQQRKLSLRDKTRNTFWLEHCAGVQKCQNHYVYCG